LSTASVVTKVGLAAAIHPVPLVALRLLVAALISWTVFPLVWPRVWRIDRRELIACSAVAVANGSGLLLYYFALRDMDASVAQVIYSLYPIITLLLLALKGERISRRSQGRLLLAILGVYLLVGPGGQVDPIGVLMVLGTALFYALHLNLIQWTLADTPTPTVTLYTLSIMALMLSVVGVFQPGGWQPLPPLGWVVVLVTGVVSTAIGRLTLFAAVHRIGSGQTALFGPLNTVFTVSWAILFLGERLSLLQIAGGILILTSAVLGTRPDR
jgi:drug/metabolite transporter (DMT)-like permease